MQDSESHPLASEIDVSFRKDRVENPEQYSTWRDYAFSEESDSDSEPPR